MEFSEEDNKTIANSLIKASCASETGWLNIEKTILESYLPSANENTSSNVLEMMNQLHRKVQDSIDRMKSLE